MYAARAARAPASYDDVEEAGFSHGFGRLATLEWWPAGAHLVTILGPRYAVIGAGVGTSEAHGLALPESGTLEAHLTAEPGPGRFIATHDGEFFDAAAMATLSTRSGAAKNPGYFSLTAKSLTNFDWLAVLNSIT